MKPIDNSQLLDEHRLIDEVLARVRDLVPDDAFSGWHVNQIKRLGRDRYLGLAHDARRGKNPAKLFVWLLRRANAGSV